MVNKNIPNIETIISLLKDTDSPVSGESIAESLGISRVAVWKLINRLKDDGYDIESGRQGYRLRGLTEKPLPRELNRLDDTIRYFDELDSTMKKADLLIENGCSDGTTIIAGRQSEGVNRSGGSWSSPEGGLYFTRIRTAPLPSQLAGLYSTAVTAAVTDALRNGFSIDAKLRWPNEVCCEGKKLCGVLTRFSGELGCLKSVSTGIGVNANTAASELTEHAASISELTGNKVSIKQLISDLLESLEETDKLFSDPRKEEISLIINNCKTNMETIGRKLCTGRRGKVISGTAVNIDTSGALVIESDGELISIYSGEDYKYV